MSWGTALDPLSFNARSTVSDGIQSVTASASGASTWATPDAGSVSFNYNWEIDHTQGDALAQAGFTQLNPPARDWSYTFTANQDAVLTLNYNVVGTGRLTDGFRGWDIQWSGPEGGTGFPGTYHDPTASGAFTRSITAGRFYTIGLSNEAFTSQDCSATCGEFPFILSGQMVGQFDWSIAAAPPESAVPEPSTWGLMLIGFGGLSVALRSRRRRALAHDGAPF